MEIKLSKPVTVGDKKMETLELKLDELTGEDFIICEREALLANANMPSIDHRLSAVFQLHLAARACGVDAAVLKKLGVRDFAEVTTAVRNFFLGSD